MPLHSLPLALGLALGAAILHAVWNVLLKTSDDPLQLSTRAVGSAMLVVTPLTVIAWFAAGGPGLPAEAWLLAVLSSVAELAYLIFLSAAYQRGEISMVYPLARGTAPVLAVPAGILLLGERLDPLELAGVALLLAGIWAVQRPSAAGPALLPALLTGVCIATYTTIDRVGVRLGPPWLYGWVLGVFLATLLLAWQFVRSTRNRRPADTGDQLGWPQAILVGLMMSATYLLILIALSLAPLSIVAPARESAIVLVTGWGIWRLRERSMAWLKLGGALTIVVGLVLLAAT